MAILATRAGHMRDDGKAVVAALPRIWVEELPTGYCTATVRPVADEHAILVDSGLSASIALASRLIARHLSTGLLTVGAPQDAALASFGRLYDAYLGQYYLFGRYGSVPVLTLSENEATWSAALTREAMTFILAHELGHVIAGHRVDVQSTRWLRPERLSADTLPAGEEIEADALAVQLVLGDLWGRNASRGLVDLRLVAMRLAFVVLGAVERCYLIPRPSQHLPAPQRWAGVRAFLESRFPAHLLTEHDRYWRWISDTLEFGPVAELEPSPVPLAESLADNGWGVSWSLEESEFWQTAEMSAWQYRLKPGILRFLIGAEAIGQDAMAHCTGQEVRAVGGYIVSEVAANLPSRLTVGGGRSQVGTSDLVYFLRRREHWPEPFRSDELRALPLHLVVAAIVAARVEGAGESA